MKIIALSRLFAESVAKDIPKPHIIISIVEPREMPIQFADNKTRLAVLSLGFYDLDYNPERWGEKDTHEIVETYGHGIFTLDQAKQIIDFVEKWKNEAKIIMVHCAAGVSRSSAVAGAISLVLNGKDQKFFSSPYIPNQFVYHTIINQWRGERRWN